MYKLYVLKGMVIEDIDAFIVQHFTLESFDKINMTYDEVKAVIKSQPYVSVKSLDSLTDAEMAELHFLMVNAGGFEDMVGSNNLESETKN